MKDSPEKILKVLSTCRKVLITTHVRPDGDALGTAAAMSLGLRQKNIASEVLLLSALPPKYDFVFAENGIRYHEAEATWPAELSLNDFDALLVVDTGTWSQLPGLKERLVDFAGQRLVIDHHLTQEDWADLKLVRTDAAAAGEIVGELIIRWGVTLDKPIAAALFLAIVSDTGWFQYSNTRPETMRLGAKLMEVGVDTDNIYQRLYQNERLERLALQTRALQSLEVLADGRLAIMGVRRADFAATGAATNDTEGLINIPLQVRSVEVSILMTEPMDDSAIRVSLRSKGSVDVARFAERFGGGGHARAAGLKLATEFEAAHDLLVAALLAQLAEEKAKAG
jgi:bifunctional oligoribonuclease and PAP phosphatase NrnA